MTIPDADMTADYQKNDLSLNDALALLLGHSLWGFRKERVDLVNELEQSLADCALALEEARKSGDDEAIEKWTAAANEASQEFERAGDLYTKLCGEIAKARKDKLTFIEIVEDDPDGRGYDLVVISRQSLLDWAEHAKINIGSAHPPPTRTHTTPLLDLLDELIQEFWETYEIGRLPTKEAIKTFVKRRYGIEDGDPPSADGPYGFPDLSDKVMASMITMMRPPELRHSA